MSQAAVHRPPVRLDASVVPGAKPAGFPGFIEPCHPTLREEAPSGGDWVHEIKFDGYRTQAHLRSRRPAVYTRAGYDWTLRFQTIADALANLPANELILDGEAVVATEAVARDLRERLDPFIRKDSPLSERVNKPKATWVEPVVEAEVAYSTVKSVIVEASASPPNL